MPDIPNNSWNEYSRLVLAELERHSRVIDALHQDFAELKAQLATRNELAELRTDYVVYKERMAAEISAIKTKSGGWGAISGAIAALVPILMMIFFQLLTRKP